MNEKATYLGDGLYASYNGFTIALRANDPDYPTDTVYLEPEVLNNFLNFVESLKEKKDE